MKYSPFISSNLPSGLSGGCSIVLLEEFEGAGLGALTLLLLTLFVSFAPLFGRVSGFCAAGSIICGYCKEIFLINLINYYL